MRVNHLQFELLTRDHNRAGFSCGVPALDNFLQRQARQEMERLVSVTYILTINGGQTIAGYYTLSNSSVRLDRFPQSITKKLPRYPIAPATLLARLAVDVKHRGQQYGRDLLINALYQCYNTAHLIGSAFVLVDAKDNAAASFYTKYGFIPFADNTQQLFLPMATIQGLLK